MEYGILNTELAYIAGLIDGEGSIFVSCQPSLIVVVVNTDKEVLEYCKGLFRLGHLNKNRRVCANHKEPWVWKITGSGAKKVIELIYPFLRIKKAQAKLALQYPVRCNSTKKFNEKERETQKVIYNALKILNKRGI